MYLASESQPAPTRVMKRSFAAALGRTSLDRPRKWDPAVCNGVVSLLAHHQEDRHGVACCSPVHRRSGAEIPAGKGKTVTFDLDGRSYEIDLTAKNGCDLRKALQP